MYSISVFHWQCKFVLGHWVCFFFWFSISNFWITAGAQLIFSNRSLQYFSERATKLIGNEEET
jgi:hypothetical protein